MLLKRKKKRDSLVGLEEHGAAVHVLALLFRNQLGARLGAEVSVVAALLQRVQEHGVVLLRLHLLQQPIKCLQVTHQWEIWKVSRGNQRSLHSLHHVCKIKVTDE